MLVGLTVFCGYGFLASYELGFLNVWHFVYAAVGVAAVIAAVWLAIPVFRRVRMGTADPDWTNYRRTLPTGSALQPFQRYCVHDRPFHLPVVLALPAVLTPHPRKTEGTTVISFTDWFIPALIGVQFTLLGSLKLYGLSRGIVGGADKPFGTKLCGT
jgi:hypothetical protein